MNRTHIAIFAVLAALALVGASAASSEIYAVDAEHDLAADDQIDQFHSEGVVTGQADNIDLTLTASESSDDVAADQLTDAGRLYIEVDYQEDIDRTLRFYIPDDYFEPYEDQSMTVHNADVQAEMEPVQGGNFTAVTVHTDGPTTATLEISTVESRLWKIRHDARDWVGDATGVSLPSLAGGEENPWEYIDSRSFAGNESVSVPADATVQYAAGETNSETTWLEVPACNRAETPVCTVSQSNETAVIAENAPDAPQVRYNTDTSFSDRVGAGFREVMTEASAQLERVRSTLSGVLS